MSRRVIRAVSLAAVVALLTAGGALADAGGQGTVTITEHTHNVVLFSAPSTNPCVRAPPARSRDRRVSLPRGRTLDVIGDDLHPAGVAVLFDWLLKNIRAWL